MVGKGILQKQLVIKSYKYLQLVHKCALGVSARTSCYLGRKYNLNWKLNLEKIHRKDIVQKKFPQIPQPSQQKEKPTK